MEGKALARAERIVRNLPISKIQYRRTECAHGEILFAYGKDGDGRYWGAWIIDQPTFIMRPIEFAKGVTSRQVQQSLIANAEWFLDEADRKGLLRTGASFGKKH